MKQRTLTALSTLALTALMACSADVARNGQTDSAGEPVGAATAAGAQAALRRAEQPAWVRRTIADIEGASAADIQAASNDWVKLGTLQNTRVRRVEPSDPSQTPLLAAINADGLVVVHGRLAVAMPGFPNGPLPSRVVAPSGDILDVPEAGIASDYQDLLSQLDLGVWLAKRDHAQHNGRTLEATQNWVRVYMALGARAFGASKDSQVDDLLNGLLATLGNADNALGYSLSSDLSTRVENRIGAARGRDDRSAWVRGLAKDASARMDKFALGSTVSKDVAAATSHWITSVTSMLWDRSGTVSVSAYELHKALDAETSALFAMYQKDGLQDLEAAAGDWLYSVDKQLPYDASPHDGNVGVLWTLEDDYGLRYGVGDAAHVHERVSRANIGYYRVHGIPKGPPLPRATHSQAADAVSFMESACAASADGTIGAQAGFFTGTPGRPTRISPAGLEHITPFGQAFVTWALNRATDNRYPENADVLSFVSDAVLRDEFMPRSSMDIPGCEPQPGDFGIESAKTADPAAYSRVYAVATWDAGTQEVCGPEGTDAKGCVVESCRTLGGGNQSPDDTGRVHRW